MNRVFKVVFNRERGKSMVVNEVTRSHQVGKKAAITVAVVGALMAGAVQAGNQTFDETIKGPHASITGTNIEVNSKDSNALNFTTKDSVIKVEAEQNISLDAKKNGIQLQTESKDVSSVIAGGDLNIKAGAVGIHSTVLDKNNVVPGAGFLVKANKIEINAGAGILNSANNQLDVEAANGIVINTNERLGISSGVGSVLALTSGSDIILDHKSGVGEKRIAVNAFGEVNLNAKGQIVIAATSTNAVDANTVAEKTVRGIYTENEKSKVVVDAKKIQISAITSNTYARAATAASGASVSIGSENTEDVVISVSGKGKKENNDVNIGLQSLGNNSNLTVTGKNLSIDVKDNGTGWAYGVISSSNNTDGISSNLNLHADNIVIKAATTTKGNSNGIVAFSEGKVNVTGNLSVTADNVISARGSAVVKINEKKDKTVQLNGDIDFTYDEETSKSPIDANVNVNLSNANSYLNGNIIRTGNAPSGKDSVSGMTLGLSNGGTWTNTAESFANKLTLDGGIVNINLADKQAHKVYVNELAGTHGTLNVEVNKTEKDFVHGSLVIDPEYARDRKADAAALLAAAAMPSLDVNLTGITADDITAEQFKEVSKDIVLEATGESTTKPTDKVETTTTVAEGDYNGAMSVVSKNGKTENVVVAEASSLMKDSLALASAGTLSLNRILMNDVRKRLGDIRVAGDMDGAWARYDGGKLSGDDGLENKFHTIQLGYDMALSNGPRVGMAASYTKGDTEYKRGDADMNAYSLAAYSVWMADNGMFADVIARVAKAENDMKVDGSRKGSLDSMAYSVSGEFGWRFDLTDMVYVEPQVEATYTYIDSDSMKLGSSRFDFDNVDSLMGRAGFAAGFKCPADKGDVYVRVSAVHEFLGDAAITGGNGKVFEVDGKDTWVEYGIGANFNVNKNTYVYADLERTSGATLDEDWRANVGVRYNF